MHNSPQYISSSHKALSGMEYGFRAMSKEWKTIPFPELSIPWADKVRRNPDASYKSSDRRIMALTEKFDMEHPPKDLESYHYGEIQKTIIGELLRIHLQKCGYAFYFASRCDNLLGKIDYIISPDGVNLFAIDTSIVPGRANNNGANAQEHKECTPREFFLAHPNFANSGVLPMITLRVNKDAIDGLTQSFFTTYNNYQDEVLETDIMEYYRDWISLKEKVSGSVAQILAISDDNNSPLSGLYREINLLFTGTEENGKSSHLPKKGRRGK